MNDYSELAERIRTELVNLDIAVRRAIELSGKAKTKGDDGYWDGVALNLHSYYSGVEHIFEDIARTIDDEIPSGVNWHTELLTQMSVERKKVRPPVISQETRIVLDKFRALRHVIRNVYAFNLRPASLNDLVVKLPDCFSATKNDLLKFAEFLESV
ncbi:MAG: hypothetical protein HYZ24_03530 [Chloroflexi bacterium]|nr:hypothetical protein [Chloroflexota bacterium]